MPALLTKNGITVDIFCRISSFRRLWGRFCQREGTAETI